MKENLFLRIGRWLQRGSMSARVQALEAAAAENKDLRDRLSKVEIFIGFRAGGGKEDIRKAIDRWNVLGG